MSEALFPGLDFDYTEVDARATLDQADRAKGWPLVRDYGFYTKVPRNFVKNERGVRLGSHDQQTRIGQIIEGGALHRLVVSGIFLKPNLEEVNKAVLLADWVNFLKDECLGRTLNYDPAGLPRKDRARLGCSALGRFGLTADGVTTHYVHALKPEHFVDKDGRILESALFPVGAEVEAVIGTLNRQVTKPRQR